MLFPGFCTIHLPLAIETTDLCFHALMLESRTCEVGLRIVKQRCREMAGFVTDRWPACIIHSPHQEPRSLRGEVAGEAMATVRLSCL